MITNRLTPLWSCALAASGACKGSSNEGSPGTAAAAHWSTQPLEPTTGTTRGTSYTIDLPKDMTLRDRGKSGMRYELAPHGLAITVSIGGAERTVDEFLSTRRDDTVYLRKDTLPDGFLVTYQNPSYDDPNDLMVHLYRGFGVDTNHAGEGMTCHASLKPRAPAEQAKSSIGVVERACLSLKMIEQK